MPKINKPKIEEEKLPPNPFSQELQIPVVAKVLEDHYKIEPDGTKIPCEIELEYTPYAKVYATSTHRKIINNLDPCSKELFLWLIYSIEHGSDYIWLNIKRYMEECSVSRNTYKKALEQLIRYGMLVPTGIYNDTYWINPRYFFKGSRVNKYPTKIQRVYEQREENKKEYQFNVHAK